MSLPHRPPSASNPSNQGSSVVIIIASATHRHHNSHPHTRHLTKRREFSFVSLHCTNTSASSYSILLRCAPFSPCLIISGSALQRLFALCATVFAFDLGCCRWVYLPLLGLYGFFVGLARNRPCLVLVSPTMPACSYPRPAHHCHHPFPFPYKAHSMRQATSQYPSLDDLTHRLPFLLIFPPFRILVALSFSTPRVLNKFHQSVALTFVSKGFQFGLLGSAHSDTLLVTQSLLPSHFSLPPPGRLHSTIIGRVSMIHFFSF
jgi:hypothetical protein